jgi:hypothetical protein
MSRSAPTRVALFPLLLAGLLRWSDGGYACANTQESDPPLPAFPQPGLSPLDRAEDETIEGLRRRSEALAQVARAAPDPLVSVEYLLAAANVILARELEPACTDRFLQIKRPSEDHSAWKAAMARAESLIQDAQAALGNVETPGEAEQDVARRRSLDHRAETLSAFAGAIARYLQVSDETDPEHSARRAASDLSPLLEDANPEVAGAAAFWRACLRSLDSDPSAALAALEPVLTDLPPEAPRFAFFSRLLRCRLLARRGGEAAALALLMQAEERVHDWFKAEIDRQSALRTIALVQMQTLRSWHDRLAATQHAEERAWCAKRLTDLAELFASDSTTVMRLGKAIPTLWQPSPDTPPSAGPPTADP